MKTSSHTILSAMVATTVASLSGCTIGAPREPADPIPNVQAASAEPTAPAPTPTPPATPLPSSTPAAAPSPGGAVNIGTPQVGTVGPGMATNERGRPYIDYVLVVPSAGTYQIDLVSASSSAYDPYLYLMHDGAEIDRNDDGGGYPNSRISRALQPGTYAVRVSSFRSSIPAPASFTLTVSRAL